MSSELGDRLRKLYAAKKLSGDGQRMMLGCEPYVLRASGNSFKWLIEAADRLDQLEGSTPAA